MNNKNELIIQKYSGLLAQANHDKILLELKVEELENIIIERENENLELKKEIEEYKEDDEEL